MPQASQRPRGLAGRGPLLLAWILLGCWTPASLARAETAAERAKRFNAEAKKAFNLGLFPEAAAAYERAYRAKPLPEFLHNLGQCHKRMASPAHREKAVFYFEAYLKNAPDAPNRAYVEREIAALKRPTHRHQARPALVPVPPPATTEQEPVTVTRPIPQRWWFWAIVVGVVGGTVTAVALTTGGSDRMPVGRAYTSADFTP